MKEPKQGLPFILKGEIVWLPVDLLDPHPDNPRQGDVGAIVRSIMANGFYGRIVCQRRPAGQNPRIIIGEHRWRAARELHMEKIPAELVDCTDLVATRIMLADNRTNDLATYDAAKLTQVLKNIIEEGGVGDPSLLEGTGYDGDDLDRLLQKYGDMDGSPLEFQKFDESLHTRLRCPKCGYEFSGESTEVKERPLDEQ